MTVVRPADWFQNGFHRFLGSYLKRHFHSIAVAHDESALQQFEFLSQRTGIASPLVDEKIPMIVYSNHPSWWDPLLAHFINKALFSPRQFYAPIDAEALQRYKVFERLGFFGVQSNSKRGAADFLKAANEIFQRPHSALWITPEGRFADSRDHSCELMPGLAHLCSRLKSGWIIPLALEYVFWEERLPECLFRFGPMMVVDESREQPKSFWSNELSLRLRLAQSELAKGSIGRDSSRFCNLLRGRSGPSGVYDFARRLKANLTGKQYRASHGDHFE